MSTDPTLPAHDYHAPFMSLPHLMRTWSAEAILYPDGYLNADANPTVMALPGYTVGVVWAGNPSHPADARRSIPLRELLPLKDMAGVSWVSLQVGDRARDIQSFTFDFPMHEPQTFDFSDTASVIMGLDCVVAVDTATAHLAAALGVPVLLMIAKESDWRWGASGDTTPWYKSVRLVRQTHSGDWRPVVDQVKNLLTGMALTRRVA